MLRLEHTRSRSLSQLVPLSPDPTTSGRQKSPDDRKVLRSLAPNYLGPGLSVHAIRKRKCALPQWVHFCTEPLRPPVGRRDQVLGLAPKHVA